MSQRRGSLVALNRAGQIPDAVLGDALELLRTDPGGLGAEEAFFRDKVVSLAVGKISPRVFLDVWSTKGTRRALRRLWQLRP